MTSKTSAGFCPQLPNETTTTKYLRQDGSWQVPPDNNTTYSAGSNITLSGTTFSLTKDNVTGALGYTPPTTNTTYSGSSTVTLSGTTFSLTKANVTTALGYTPPTSDTNNAVTQTNTTGAAAYRVLYSVTADDTNRTEGARKGRLYFDPGNVRLAFNNGYGFYGNVSKALTFQDGSDSNHAIVHGAYGGDANQWGLWPNKDGWESLGVSARRWGQIYSTSSSISTSDRNEKKDIESLNEKSKELIMNLNPVSFKFKEGKSGRTHYGLIAQDVEETLDKLSMSALDFAGFCKDQKYEEIHNIGEDGIDYPSLKPIDGEYIYGLRYEEFIAPLIKTVQIQQKQINKLEKEIELLKKS